MSASGAGALDQILVGHETVLKRGNGKGAKDQMMRLNWIALLALLSAGAGPTAGAGVLAAMIAAAEVGLSLDLALETLASSGSAAAAALSAPVFNSVFKLASSVEAAATVMPFASSMIWAYIFLPDRNTDKRGRPCAFCLIW